jgi:SAM-dependent MidA family methyltransferase
MIASDLSQCELQRSQVLQAKISAAIAASSTQSILFSEYMRFALYEDGLGYYRHHHYQFGAKGDYYTAPEISALFSHCLAVQCAQVLQSVEHGDLLEIGAGSGTMCADILQKLAELQQLPNHYYIIEPHLPQQQAQKNHLMMTCPELCERVVWLQSWPETPINGVILANEVLDALPVECFVVRDNEWRLRAVTEADGVLTWCEQPIADSALAAPFAELQAECADIAFAQPYFSEYSLATNPFIADVQVILARGAVLFIDYGYPRHEYYLPSRSMGTLLCYRKQHVMMDPLCHPGLQDITAHVDFTRVALAAVDHGLAVAGFTHQAGFLLNCGVLTALENSQNLTATQRFARNQCFHLLTSPNEMGEQIKVLALTRDINFSLLGFQLYNQIARL